MERQLDFIESVKFILECYENGNFIYGIDPWHTHPDGSNVEMATMGIIFAPSDNLENKELLILRMIKFIAAEKERGTNLFTIVYDE